MSDDESSEDEKMKALMANWQREDDSHDDKPKKKTKKKRKKKEKDDAEEADDGSVEKKDKKKKKKSKEKDKEKKEKSKEKTKSKSKEKESSPESPKKTKKKSKDKEKNKKKDKDKDNDKKSKKKKKDKDPTPEPESISPPPPVVLDQIDYVDDDDGNASETSDDRKMKELLQQWDEDGDDSSGSSSSDEEEQHDEDEPAFEERRMTKAELGLEDNSLDHIVLAAPNFEEAMKEFETMTGIKPSVGGSLKGLGTITARVGLDNQAYIEIIAPDPKKPGPIGDHLMDLEEGSLVPIHYAIRQTDLSDLADDYVPNELGYDPDRIAMFRAGTDGLPRKWEMLFMHGHLLGGTVPYFVDWGDCEHPIGCIAQVGSLKSLVVSCPVGSKVSKLLKGMKGITVVDGELGLEFSFGSPEGTITFSGDRPPGLKFPGYEEKKPAGEVVMSDGEAEDEDSNEDEDESDEDYEDSEAHEEEDKEETEAVDEDEISAGAEESDGEEDEASDEEEDEDEVEEGSEDS